ncbi:hypothetical protein [Noviherbaspirillum album]|uniref:hypothetical protein n=1 Tax=Noviherbaspirillum album TaxID=3080276 RepID=UPI002DD6953A|nr:hypothetical protein [Noviherbaspirillum sp. CPCC 100848]
MRSATADIERYTLPRFLEADNISKMVSASVAASAYGIEIPRLQQTLMAMQAPWLDTLHIEQSIRGFVELQAIGQALNTLDPFGERLTTALRQGLGDMRDPITWTPETISDPTARTSVYIERGFQAELTNFPEEAFEESLERSGIIIEPPALVVRYSCPVPPSDNPELEAAFARTNVAHDWLQRFETYIRSFIDKVMTGAFGPNWMKSNDPGGLRDAWTAKKRKVEAWSGQDRPLIAYADITDYERIICNGKNWAAFERFFVTKENARESLQRISGPRLGTMHARPLTAEEVLFLQVEMHRFIKLTER